MTEYECLECPQILKNVEKGERIIQIADDIEDEPLFCPWCGNRSLIEDGVNWEN